MRKFGVLLLIAATILGCQKSTPPRAEPPKKITLAFTDQPDCALVHIALTKGYFAHEGFDIQPQMHTYGKAALNSVLEGKADMATVGETPIMFSVLNGGIIAIVATIFTSNKNNAVIGRRDHGLTTPDDLRGKRIAVTPGTTGEFFMDSFFTAIGMSRKNVEQVDLKPEEMFEALATGKVDAAVASNFTLIRLQKELGDKGVTFFDKEIYTETFNIAAQQDFVLKNPDSVKKFLRALIKAEQFAREYPDKSQELVAASLQIDKNLVHEVWNSFEFRVALNQALLVELEAETRWAMKNRLTDRIQMPNYLDFISLDNLLKVKPDSIGIIR